MNDSAKIDPATLDGQTVALVAWGDETLSADADGAETVVITGRVAWDGSALTLSQGEACSALDLQLLERLQPVPEHAQAMLLNASYFISIASTEIPKAFLNS